MVLIGDNAPAKAADFCRSMECGRDVLQVWGSMGDKLPNGCVSLVKSYGIFLELLGVGTA